MENITAQTSPIKRVSFIDVQALHAEMREEILTALAKVLDSGAFILGENVRAFEEEFARFCGSPTGVAVGSGTDALVLALEALGIGQGDEVIVPVWTFVATAAAVCHVGATPVFVDCAPDSYLLDLKQVAARITSKTKAIIPVHIYGEAADTEAVQRIIGDRRIKIIEDVAQAAGATLRGRTAGSIGHAGCFSFYPTKTLGACGEGGMVLTGDPEIAKRIKHFRNQADDTTIGGKKYHHSAVGYNSRLQEMQAAILRIKLRRLADWNAHRIATAQIYRDLLSDCPIKLPRVTADGSHVYSLFTIRAPHRDELVAWLGQHNIGTATCYPVPLHLQPAYRPLGYKEGDFLTAEGYAKEVLSLPMHPTLTADEAAYVAEMIKAFFRGK